MQEPNPTPEPLLPQDPAQRQGRGWRRVAGQALAVLILAATVVAGFMVYQAAEDDPHTDDAGLYAVYISVAPQISGHIVELTVRENQRVAKGDLLFTIDPRPYSLARDLFAAQVKVAQSRIEVARREIKAAGHGVKAAQANIEVFRAQLRLADETLARLRPLEKKGFVTAEKVDAVEADRRRATAGLAAAVQEHLQLQEAIPDLGPLEEELAVARAGLAQAELQLEYTQVRAPFAGRVVNCNLAVGAFALTAKPVFTLIDDGAWFARANFLETDLARIKPGMPAQVQIMTDASRRYEGVVDSVGWAVQGHEDLDLIKLPFVRNTLDWVRLAQRFPVLVRIKEPRPDHLFRIGASATVTVYTDRDGEGS